MDLKIESVSRYIFVIETYKMLLGTVAKFPTKYYFKCFLPAATGLPQAYKLLFIFISSS